MPSPRVQILTDRVANQIAAGEVIERPAAVIKELLENSLDAGATRVEVEFRHGGRSLMRVEDNGHGMSRDNALLALERHATSKITQAADLDALHTFGFRGEAIPSIASVSRFTLQTRAAGELAGTEILVNGGVLSHVRDCGRPVGTRIEAAQLFNSVPARRKFLKTDATESAHIITTVRLYALAFPNVAFTLVEDGRPVFHSPENPGLHNRVREILGRQLADGLIEINASEPGLKLSGLISKPGSPGRSTRHEMLSFINNRPVDSRALNYALLESYAETLPRGRYPVTIVFLEINPAAVDVNVHPAKREVRFRNETAVRGFVINSILARLRAATAALAPTLPAPKPDPAVPVFIYHSPTRQPAAPSEIPNPKSELPSPPEISNPKSQIPPAFSPPSAPSASPPPSSPAPAPRWRYLDLLHNHYALYETPAGLVLMDRRAAGERIWFERLQAEYRAGRPPTQKLLFPVPLEFDPVSSSCLLDRIEFFSEHGVEIAEFGRNFFRIEAIPVWMEPADAAPHVRELVANLRDGALHGANLDLAREALARLSASKAVNLGRAPDADELRRLPDRLFACRNPMTSPSGKPTHFEIPLSEIARRLQR